MRILYLIASFVLCYVICSINFAVIISKLVTKKDIREQGSGNAGMTNMMRSVGKVAGTVTFLLDVVKAVVSMLLCKLVLLPNAQIPDEYIRYCIIYLCIFFCVIGHVYPLFFHFKGGKGVASVFGAILVADWRVALFSFAAFLVIFAFARIVSIASVTATILAVMTTFLVFSVTGVPAAYIILSIVTITLPALVVVLKHRDNIIKLAKGEEKQLTIKK